MPRKTNRRSSLKHLASFCALSATALFSNASTTAFAQVNLAPASVEETQIARDAFSMGVLSPENGGLAPSLWANADPDQLALLLRDAPAQPSSSVLGQLQQRILLSSTAAPKAGDAAASPQQISALAGGKLLALVRGGYTEEARTIASLSNASRSDAGVNRALAEADLLDGDLDAACRRNSRVSGNDRAALFWVKLRILCYAADEAFDAADLTLGILREQGGLTDGEAALFTAVSIPAPLKKPIAPVSALHLAAVRQIKGPLPAATLDVADPGVLAAIALDETIGVGLRAAAGERALYAGRLSATELAEIYRAAPMEGADAQTTSDLAPSLQSAGASNSALVTARVYQQASVMASPDFDRDKAGLLGRALNAATSPYATFALARVFENEIKAFDGMLVTPEEAGGLALGAMVNGDADAAGKWLLAMLGGGLSEMEEPLALAFLERASLLAVLDPVVGAAIAASANVTLSSPASADVEGDVDRLRLARHVEAAIDAVANDAPGQKMLASIVLSEAAAMGDPVAASVLRASLKSAGLSDLARRHAFETAWRAGFPEAPAPAEDLVAGAEDDGFTPSLKPQRVN
ncbi:MAG: hypothetical protein AAF224_07935 [Pseudomonadota bacterium]